MNGPIIQLLVLAGIAVFLILKLRSVLGTREGYEKPFEEKQAAPTRRSSFEVIEGGPDLDITDHVPEKSDAGIALANMKRKESSFTVNEFLRGARGAYEMILMNFESGDLAAIKPYLSKDVYDSFAAVVSDREEKGLTVEANFVGISELALADATFDENSGEAELTVRYIGELTSVVRDKGGDIIEGDEKKVKRQKDVWTFARTMGENDPNWILVATGE